MNTSAQDVANATAKCPGTGETGAIISQRFGRSVTLRCSRCSFTWTTKVISGVTDIAPWHRAVR